MTWKELINTKRMLPLLLVSVATLATVLILQVMMQTRTSLTPGTSARALPTSTDEGNVLQLSGVTGTVTPASGSTANDGSLPTQLADNSDVYSNAPAIADVDADGVGYDGTGPDSHIDDFAAILLANHAYPKHDYDFQTMESRGGVGVGLQSIPTDTCSGGANAPPSHAPEPASMLLLGSALVGVAIFGRRLKKT